MANPPITREEFEEWATLPVTRRLFKKLIEEREDMKEGLANSSYEFEDIVKGRCQAIALILDVTYERLLDNE